MECRKNQHKLYAFDQSPLYRLKSRKKLATLFNTSLNDLERLAKRPDNYRHFILGKERDKSRQVEVPKPKLERIHRRLFNLLRRIMPPSYLHSGVKKRSYITNAAAHVGNSRLIKLDIQKFYPSTLGWHVFEFYFDVLHCSRDVAGLLTLLSVCRGHVPTGSCLSQVTAFYAHYKMFEAIYELTQSLGLTMTCYVDDIAISGEKANRSTLYRIRGILKQRGLQSPAKKEFVYEKGYPKEVTGSIVLDDGLRLPNKKHMGMHHEVSSILRMEDSTEKLRLLNVVIGRAVAGSQSDPKLVTRIKSLLQEKTRVARIIEKKSTQKLH